MTQTTTREIKQTSAHCRVMTDVPPDDPVSWMIEQLGSAEAYVLAQAWDGVTWGRVQNGALTPTIPLRTLQELRVFNADVEGLLWRDGTAWRARWLGEAPPAAEHSEASYEECIDEGYLLWGNKVEEVIDGFSRLRDGAQGLRHAVPLPLKDGDLPLRLVVRHYLKADEDGQIVVDLSRLVDLRPNKPSN
ncbi:CRISPR-associated protein Csx19 [Aggregatilineales bacterium SYSU G02658]